VQITLHNDAPFSLLQVCVEFGLPLLQSYLTHHVTSNLTPDTVCHTLVGASSLMKTCRDDSLKLALRQIVHESRTFIRNHQNLVLEGKGMLEMSKEALLGVLSDTEVSGRVKPSEEGLLNLDRITITLECVCKSELLYVYRCG